jgi:hypothetical protein
MEYWKQKARDLLEALNIEIDQARLEEIIETIADSLHDAYQEGWTERR